MARPHPVREGFGAVIRQPGLALAEIAWRWSFGAAAWVLVGLSLHQILLGVDVGDAELAIARRSSPFLIADAIAHILYEVLPRLVRISAVLIPALALLWIFAASLGRSATLNALLAERGQLRDDHPGFSALLGIHLVRVAVTLAAVAGLFGAIIISSTITNPQPDTAIVAALLWLAIAVLVAFFWSILNWFLSLAPIFIVRDGRGTFASIADSLALYRDHRADYAGTTAWFCFLRSLALLGAIGLSVMPLGITDSVRVVVLVVVIVSLAYFAMVDSVYIARIAAFVALADESSAEIVPSAAPQDVPPEPPVTDPQAQVP